MTERLTLARRIDEDMAKRRLQRLGATACEPAWVSLWATALGLPKGTPGAWLLCAKEMRRALLLVGTELPTQVEEPSSALNIDSGLPPTPEALNRLWLWERMGTPRHWRIQVLDSAPMPTWLPCWLGYARGRQHRLLVISGLSGEPLPMLKPIVLRGLQQAYRNGPESERKSSRANERREKAV
ncbi:MULTISPECIES: hypothetical protein [Halomonadaceae]|uniref:Uncharacterized protein n=1 Tax=Vreelandella titanicae TaxID=664683 RepID=A0AAP9NSG5_9GAMM|nr:MULTISPECIES: hypothetical protein [Halomonas]QKS26302.1 hypothetical protein FX987_04099 [Halomonas titanicae]CDG52516.1 conserved hypothetical protein [Halomonas sp. A3H3]SDI59804.1 hypothetical protein SAMN04487867_109168 [Halomonas titanicae]|tara:strand:+ start:365 stop:913 length:549 start_codon:yes stop_codon:yes gene_type:complete